MAMQSKDDKKFGETIGRLQQAASALKPILKDAPKYKPFNEEILRNLKEVEKDNNFIYHEVVPSKDKLESVKPAVVAKQTLYDKNKLLIEGESDIFEAVVPLQGNYIANLYNQMRKYFHLYCFQ